MTNELTPSEVSELLKYTIGQNAELAKQGLKPVAINIEGAAGISKSSTVRQTCEELNTHHYIQLNLAECDGGDLVGFPIVEYKVCKGEECTWISDKILKDYVLQGYNATGESRMSYAKPTWLVGKEDKPVTLVLDDFNRASPLLLNACMRITLEQEYVSWNLPQGSSVILTSNPDDGEDSFNVSTADSAQKSRYITIKMKPSVNDWALNYAEKVGISSAYINFLLKHPEIIEGSKVDAEGNVIKGSNLRMWTKFFELCGGLTNNLSENWGILFNLGQNSLPKEHLLLLHSFINNKLDKLKTPEELLKMNSEDSIKELKSCIGTGDKRRDDISSVLSRRLMNYTLVNYKKFTKDMTNNYCEILESGYLSPDLVLLSVKKVAKNLPDIIKRPKLVAMLTT